MSRAFLTICFFSCIVLANAQYYSANSYPPDYHGTKLQSGQRYSKFLNTASHRNIPLGSKVLLTERKTGRSVIVEVNDRIEETSSDFILSDAAYHALGLELGRQIEIKYKLLEEGEFPVRSNKLVNDSFEEPKNNQTMLKIGEVQNLQKDKYYLQLGVFSSYASALNFFKNLSQKQLEPLFLMQSKTKIFRVLTGIYSNEKEARNSKKRLQKDNVTSIVKSGAEMIEN